MAATTVTRRRTSRRAMAAWIAVVQTPILEQVVIAGRHGRYSRTAQVVSELGDPACGGATPCTDLSTVFRASVMVSAVLLVVGVVGFTRSGALGIPFAATLFAGAVGLVGIAAFPLATHPVAHAISANLFFSLVPVTLLLRAADAVRSARARSADLLAPVVATACAFVATGAWVVHASAIANDAGLAGAVQRVMLYSVIGALMALGPALSSVSSAAGGGVPSTAGQR